MPIIFYFRGGTAKILQFCRGARGGKFVNADAHSYMQLHVNGQNSGIFIFISHENSLIATSPFRNRGKKQNISVPVNVGKG